MCCVVWYVCMCVTLCVDVREFLLCVCFVTVCLT